MRPFPGLPALACAVGGPRPLAPFRGRSALTASLVETIVALSCRLVCNNCQVGNRNSRRRIE